MLADNSQETRTAVPVNSGDQITKRINLVKMYENKSYENCWSKHFPVNGQGTFIFNIQSSTSLWISVEDENGDNSLVLLVDAAKARFLQKSAKPNEYFQLRSCGHGLAEGKVSYWYSYDRNNLVLKYGQGYRMEETTLMQFDFLQGATTKAAQDKIRDDFHLFFNAEVKKYVRQYNVKTEKPVAGYGVQITEQMVEFEKHPFIRNVPPLVLDSSKINLFDLDAGKFVFSASLPPACQELYKNIKKCTLDSFLSHAIRHSLTTEGLALQKKIIEKSGEDKCLSYLRVTLGNSLGKSPGIPYVLEIWPKGHYSPIHNHGNANAVIKVLFGTVRVNIFNKDTKSLNAKPIKVFDAYQGDVTWINRNWYQTHKLHNVSDDYCATLQCYTYDEGDTTHWKYFDYVKENKPIAEFLPNSDFTFKDMCEIVLKEYDTKPNE